VLSLPLSFFSEERKGDILARVSTDVNEVDSSITSSLDMIIKNPIFIVIYLITLITISWQLTLFTLLVVPLMAFAIGRIGKKLKKKSAEIIEAVEGFNMTQEQKERVRIIQGHFADIDKRISQIDEIIGRLTAEHEGTISLLCTIPGIDRRLAITIISEIGTDMSEFGSSRRLCSWAGLVPGNNQSAGKKKSVRITRAGVYLKPALVEAAHAAVKATEKSPYFRIKYEKIMKRRGKKRAIIAIARMILTSIYAMVSTGEVFNPSDLLKYDMPEELLKKRTLAEAKDAVKLLVSLGLVAEGSISLEALAS
jgi:hypothetical protein